MSSSSDFLDGYVAEIPANGGAPAVIYNAAGSEPSVTLAVDAAGDLFIADYGLAKVEEIPAGCTSSCSGTLGWRRMPRPPQAVAVDAAGDVFVTDEEPKVVEVPAGCIQQQRLPDHHQWNLCVRRDSGWKGQCFLSPTAAAAPHTLNPDNTNNQVVVVNKSQPPSFKLCHHECGQHQQALQPADGLRREHREHGARFHLNRLSNVLSQASGLNTDCPTASSGRNAGRHLHAQRSTSCRPRAAFFRQAHRSARRLG